jgi:hypothetical protein
VRGNVLATVLLAVVLIVVGNLFWNALIRMLP